MQDQFGLNKKMKFEILCLLGSLVIGVAIILGGTFLITKEFVWDKAYKEAYGKAYAEYQERYMESFNLQQSQLLNIIDKFHKEYADVKADAEITKQAIERTNRELEETFEQAKMLQDTANNMKEEVETNLKNAKKVREDVESELENVTQVKSDIIQNKEDVSQTLAETKEMKESAVKAIKTLEKLSVEADQKYNSMQSLAEKLHDVKDEAEKSLSVIKSIDGYAYLDKKIGEVSKAVKQQLMADEAFFESVAHAAKDDEKNPVEVGKNYMRIGDVQICWGSVLMLPPDDRHYKLRYFKSFFPKPFAEFPHVTTSIQPENDQGLAYSLFFTKLTKTMFRGGVIEVNKNESATEEVLFQYVAIGKWRNPQGNSEADPRIDVTEEAASDVEDAVE